MPTRCGSSTRRFLGFVDFPADPREQLARRSAQCSSRGAAPRAVAYRQLNGIPEEWGTAVNVQQMVFGNRGRAPAPAWRSRATRSPARPSPAATSSSTPRARTSSPASARRAISPSSTLAARDPPAALRHPADGSSATTATCRTRSSPSRTAACYMLQTRSAKRHARAAVRFAVDAVDEGLLTPAQAIATIDADRLDALLHPTFDAAAALRGRRARRRGVAGRGEGRDRLHRARRPSQAGADGRDVDPRAPVHRGRGRRRIRRRQRGPDVRGRQGVARRARGARHGPAGRRPVRRTSTSTSTPASSASARTCCARATAIAIDGTAGAVTLDDVPLVVPDGRRALRRVLAWCDELRMLGVRANADTPEDARRARELGAEGVGLCRTEHMFMAADRQPKMRALVLADDEAGAAPRSTRCCRSSSGDFAGLFAAMDGRPVTIRLLDPPLHEFLPDRAELAAAIARAELLERAPDCRARARGRARSARSRRATRCSARAASASACSIRRSTRCSAARSSAPRGPRAPRARARDHDPARRLRAGVRAGARRRCSARRRARRAIPATRLRVGTMIELPRACLTAGEIARSARVLLVRHQRPDADHARLLARRHRGAGSSRRTSSAHILAPRRSARSTSRASAS